ncbi:MAG: PorP/SprF family type IX secretion system membrane protein [Terrimonas sp.]|nr:PorP/SprF family type IX secretion system membrane protein [Terrimonas sp.]OJY95809.1 MAG: hypothetical protein BGP13_00500 [Sphingobacteriales bacterium 40-81]
MRSILRNILLMWMLLMSSRAISQVDPHFSQYFIQPMLLNPALTGAIEGDYRVSAIWRSQYENTFTTAGVSAEMVTNKNINLGINILNQSSSDKAYNFSNAYLSAAYTGARFGNHYLVMAMQAGFINRRFDVSKLQFGDQWTAGIGYDHNTTSADAFNRPSVFTFDAGAGALYYDATPDKKINLFAGFSAYHLSQPKDPFISGSGEKHLLPIRYSAHAGARIILNDFFNIVPNILYMRQGNSEEKMAGAYVQINASENVDLMVGANMRFNDALSPFAGFYYKGLTVGMSYDTGISTKDAMTINRNSVEVSLSYTWWRKNSMQTKPFFCPRF